MPTMPDPNSPFMDSRLQSEFGARIPGMPSSAGKPGVQAADLSFPAPPAVATAPPGRPPEAQPAAPMQPMTPPAAPAGKPPTAAVPSATATSPTGGAQPAQQAQAGLPVGTRTMPTVRPDGSVAHTLTPEGQDAYRQAALKTRTALGQMPAVFTLPGMPELEVLPGKHNYNPVTGKWSK